MSLLRPLVRLQPSARIETARLALRAPEMRDFDDWSRVRADSRDFLVPWEPTWPADDLTRDAFKRRVRRHQRDAREDLAYAFFLFTREDQRLVGGVTLSNVRRGVTQAATIGYWMGAAWAGRGLMTEAVRAIARHVFEDLLLHRLEAACVPSNERSARLLRRIGFTQEGVARAYLRIDGAWRDHILWALVDGDPIG